MYYIGVHRGTFDDGYICSSKSMLKEYHQRPQEFKREILHVVVDYPSAREIEICLLESVNAKSNTYYYNRTNGYGVFDIDKINKDPEKIEKMAQKHRGMKRSDVARKNMSDARLGCVPWNKGRLGIYTDTEKERIGRMNRGKKWFHDPETGENKLFHVDASPSNFVRGMLKIFKHPKFLK